MKKLICALFIFSLGCGVESRKEPSQASMPQAPIPEIQASVASPVVKDIFDPSKPPASEHERIVLHVTGVKDKIIIDTLGFDTVKVNLTKEAFHVAQIIFPKNDVPKLIFYRQMDTGTSFSKEYPLNRIQNMNGDPLYQSDDNLEDKTQEHEDCVERTFVHPIYEVSKTKGKWHARFKLTEIKNLLPLNKKGVLFKNKAQELFSPTLSIPEVTLALEEEGLSDLKPHDIETISREIMIDAHEEPLEIIKKNKKSKKKRHLQ